MHPQLPLVVVRTAGADAALLDDGLEGIGAPLLARIDRHHVVMAVHQYRTRLRIDDLLGIDHRIALGGHHLGPIGSRLDELRGQKLRTALHVGPMLGLGADRRDAQQIEQLADEAILIRLYIMFYLIHKSILFSEYVGIGKFVFDRAARTVEHAERPLHADETQATVSPSTR